MAEALDPSGVPVQVGTLIISTPGLVGQARSLDHAGALGTRGPEQGTLALDAALRETDLETMEVVEISDTQEVDVPFANTRSTSYGEPAMVITAPDPGDEWGQVILYVDEDGVTTWELPVERTQSVDATRGGGTRTFVLRRRVPVVRTDDSTHRGLLGSIGKKILRVLAFKLVDRIGGAVGNFFAGRWEKHKRPYRVRTFTPGGYRLEAAGAVDWPALGAGRALLMMHGTFSRAHSGFQAMPESLVSALHAHYSGRVFAYDHFTLSADPLENARWFLSQIPDGSQLELDIVCHSRGGLVARTLAELQSQLPMSSRKLSIRKIVFVASPNSGTPLTDARYMGDFIDSYTNLLQLFPDNGATDILECVITLLKQFAVGALKGLDGLQSMNPKGEFLASMNQGDRNAERRYFALCANFEPLGGLKAFAKDRFMDAIFKQENDLVVPTSSAFAANGSGMFPLTDHVVLPAELGVHHTAFFGHELVVKQLHTWLTSPEPAMKRAHWIQLAVVSSLVALAVAVGTLRTEPRAASALTVDGTLITFERTADALIIRGTAGSVTGSPLSIDVTMPDADEGCITAVDDQGAFEIPCALIDDSAVTLRFGTDDDHYVTWTLPLPPGSKPAH